MRVDFSEVEDVEEFASVPEGTYLCKVAEVHSSTTREGSQRLWYRLVVEDGDHAGRTAAIDGITFSQRALVRAKHVLEMLGFDVAGEVDVTPAGLEGRRALVQIVYEEREDPVSGKRQMRPRVPFRGYASAETGDLSERLPWEESA